MMMGPYALEEQENSKQQVQLHVEGHQKYMSSRAVTVAMGRWLARSLPPCRRIPRGTTVAAQAQGLAHALKRPLDNFARYLALS